MCKPPCCNDSGGQGAGVAAVALFIGAALIAAKIGPIVASIVHTVLEVIRLAALTIGMVVALAVLTWAVIAVTRWQLKRKALTTNPVRMAASQSCERLEPVTGRGHCLACGGTGTVLRTISGSQYQAGECPVCEPVRRAG